MKRNLQILIVLLLISFGKVNAQQSISDADARFINHSALMLVEKYTFSFSFRYQSDYDDFYNLFTDYKVEVFNNVLPDNNLDSSLDLDTYLDVLRKYYKEMYVAVEPYELSPIKSTDGNTGTVVIYSKMMISGPTKVGMEYVDTFDVVFNVAFNIDKDEYLISGIKSIGDYGKYSVISAGIAKGKGKIIPLKNDSIYVNNTVAHLDKKGLTLLKRITKDTSIVITPCNAELFGQYVLKQGELGKFKGQEKHEDKNVITLGFKYPRYSLGIYGGFGLLPSLSSTSSDNPTSFEKFSSFQFGIEYGIIISVEKLISLNIGAYYKKYSFDMQLSEFTRQYEKEDDDDYPYLRIDSISNIKQSNSINLLSFPLLLEKKINIGRKIYLNMGLGGILYYTQNSTYEIEADASYGGLYHFTGTGYDFSVFMNDKSIYDFGSYPDMSGDGNMNFKQLNFGISSKLGFGYKLSKQSSIEINVTYNRSFGEVFMDEGKDLSSNKTYINSLSDVFPHYVISELFTNIGFNFKY